MAVHVAQSSRREGVVGTGSSPGSNQIPRSVRLRVHMPSAPRGQQDSLLTEMPQEDCLSLPQGAGSGRENKVTLANCISSSRQCINTWKSPPRNSSGISQLALLCTELPRPGNCDETPQFALPYTECPTGLRGQNTAACTDTPGWLVLVS